MKHTILFEFFERKMKIEVEANSPDEAKEKVKNRIIFHEIRYDSSTNYKEKLKDEVEKIFDKGFETISELFDEFSKKKK